MKQVIYSLYIDISTDELDYQPPFPGEKESKNDKAKRNFAEHADWLTMRQKEYAKSIGVDYFLFENDDRWKAYKEEYQTKYPFLTVYNIVNFYKIHLMYELAKDYESILYIDLDVTPLTTESFFDKWDLDRGIAIFKNFSYVDPEENAVKKEQERFEKFGETHSIRSPAAKWWNSLAMTIELGGQVNKNDHPVFNTGIVGINRDYLEKLAYFDEFDDMLDLMSELKDDEYSMYPDYVKEMFGWDNETLWSVKVNLNDVKIQWLDKKWHYFMDSQKIIPKATKLVHTISKEFDFVREHCEKNNL
tara:strand:- start:556 stop:1464 length:909 start_codon:yes stop_codon:yes gene_type:complete